MTDVQSDQTPTSDPTPDVASSEMTPDTPDRSEHSDPAVAEIETKVAADNARGYVGETFDPNPNDAYSILTGPDAPPLVAGPNERVADPDANR